MSKHTISGYLYHIQYDFQVKDEFKIEFHKASNMAECSGGDWTLIREVSFEVEVPDDFDPRPAKVAALTTEKQKVRAEFAKRITELDEQINKLLAIENSVRVEATQEAE